MNDALNDAFDKAARPALETIASDRARLEKRLRPLFDVLADKLFDADLELEKVRLGAGFRDKRVWSQVAEVLGQNVRAYVPDLRLATAARLLMTTSLSIPEVGFLVGYSSHSTFRRAYEDFSGARPEDDRRRTQGMLKRAGPPPPELDSDEYWRRLAAGELDDDEVRELDDFVARLHPSSAPTPTITENPWIEVRRKIAARLAESVDEQPWPEQRRLVRDAVLFPDYTLYEALYERSFLAKDPSRGAQLALLSIDALASNGLLELDLRLAGLAWARLGTARWRADDPAGAEDAFRHSQEVFERTPEDHLVPSYEAHRCLLATAFAWSRRRFDEALEAADNVLEKNRAVGPPWPLRALLLRAELRSAADDLEGALEDIAEARGLIEDPTSWEAFMTFDLWLQLLVASPRRDLMLNALPEVRRRAESIDSDNARYRLQWFEGHCLSPQKGHGLKPGDEQRVELWRGALQGFLKDGGTEWIQKIAFDLLVATQDGPADEAVDLLALLGTLADSPEDFAVLARLRDGAAAGRIEPEVLRDVRQLIAKARRVLRTGRAVLFT